MKSICLIPEGTHNKNTLDYGKVYEVSNIKRLKEYDEFAGSIDSRIMFLSYNKGVVYSDEDVTPYKDKNIYKILNIDNNCKTLAHSMYSFCVEYGVSTVYLLIDKLGPFKKLIKSMQDVGIIVKTPYLFGDE